MRAVLFDMDGVLVFSEDAWFFAQRLDAVRVNPEAAEVLGALRARGVRTALATNTNRPLAELLAIRIDSGRP